jgi:cytochrome c biogenesis protein CcdA
VPVKETGTDLQLPRTDHAAPGQPRTIRAKRPARPRGAQQVGAGSPLALAHSVARRHHSRHLPALAAVFRALAAAAMLMVSAGPAIAQPRVERAAPEVAEASDAAEPVLWYFWRDRCPHCARAEAWLETLIQRYPALELRKVEVVQDDAGRALFFEMMRERGERASGVPSFILDDAVWVGFSQPLADDIEEAVAARLTDGVQDSTRARRVLDMGPLGTVDLAAQPMILATVLIAFVDGFNPCSLWVLTVLLAMILATRSRARIAAVGLTFLLVTAAIYGVFIAGLFAAFAIAGQLGWIQVAVALLALAFGAVNVKDYFAYKKGLSFTIPERFKPRIYRGGRAVRKDRPLPVTLAITVALASGVALVELPCTAGFPVIWTNLVSEAGVGTAGFGGLLAVYLLVYLSVEITILVVAIVTLRASRMQEIHGRTLKLFGGMVMIALAFVLLFDPSLMEQLASSLLVIAAAVAASTVILLADRWWRARRGSHPEA